MNGTQEYTEKNNSLIQTLLKKNMDKPYLVGFSHHLKLNRSEQTTYNYLKHVVNFMDSCKKQLSEIGYDDYIIYENQFIDMTPSYRIVKHSALKAFSEYLYLTKQNPYFAMENSKAPKATEKIETKEKRENNYLTPEEALRYIKTVEAGVGTKKAISRQKLWRNRDIAIVMILLNTGMRCSALYKLDVSDIDFETKRFSIKEKGKNRTYILNDVTLEAIEAWLVDRHTLLDGEIEDALFISNQKTRMSIRAISMVTEKYGKYIKDIHLTPHKLRATFGTNLYAMTGDIRAVKDAMGHSSIHTTEIYIRGQEEKSRQLAADKMQQMYEVMV